MTSCDVTKVYNKNVRRNTPKNKEKVMIFTIIICSLAVVYSINKALINLEKKQEILYYNMFLLRQKIRDDEKAYLY